MDVAEILQATKAREQRVFAVAGESGSISRSAIAAAARPEGDSGREEVKGWAAGIADAQRPAPDKPPAGYPLPAGHDRGPPRPAGSSGAGVVTLTRRSARAAVRAAAQWRPATPEAAVAGDGDPAAQDLVAGPLDLVQDAAVELEGDPDTRPGGGASSSMPGSAAA